MSRCYTLNDQHEPVPCDLLGLESVLADVDKRRVGWTEIGSIIVSTVFLGLDHNYTGKGPPILFETMIDRGDGWDEQERYRTWDEAVAGHAAAVDRVRSECP